MFSGSVPVIRSTHVHHRRPRNTGYQRESSTRFLADRIRARGHQVLLIDVGTLGGTAGATGHHPRRSGCWRVGFDPDPIAARQDRGRSRDGDDAGGAGSLMARWAPGEPDSGDHIAGRRRRNGHRHGGHARAADRVSQVDGFDPGKRQHRAVCGREGYRRCCPASWMWPD